jgi:hypothetical protein
MWILRAILLVILIASGACRGEKKPDMRSPNEKDSKQILTQYDMNVPAAESYERSNLESVFPHKNKFMAYGSMFPMCNAMHLNELTKARIQQLKQWAEGVDEGDACSGSIKIKDRKE